MFIFRWEKNALSSKSGRNSVLKNDKKKPKNMKNYFSVSMFAMSFLFFILNLIAFATDSLEGIFDFNSFACKYRAWLNVEKMQSLREKKI